MQSQSSTKKLRRAVSAIALTVQRSIGFFFAAKSARTRNCPVCFHTPIRNLSFHFVIRMKARFNHTVGRVWLAKELTQIQCRPSSLLVHAFSSLNIIHRTACLYHTCWASFGIQEPTFFWKHLRALRCRNQFFCLKRNPASQYAQ